MKAFSKLSFGDRRFLLACTAAASMLVADAAFANVLVIRSTGPSSTSYKPGRALPDNARVALRPGDELIVLASDSTRTLKGPGNFALASAAPAAAPQLNSMRRGRFSALRTAGIVPRSPTIWHVDVSQSGKVCLADPSNVTLWRPNATRDVKLTLTGANGSTQTADWPAGQATLAWPTGMSIVPGADYQVSWAGNPKPTHISFATLSSMPTDLTSVAQALIEKNCQNQLDLLIETVPSNTTSSK